MKTVQTLTINKYNFADCNIQSNTLESLKDGEVRLKIDRFALTSNNITYAVVGDQMDYWNFFPIRNILNNQKKQDEFGIIPVWGFATVVDGKHAEINTGQKYYGYYPMANYLTVSPVKNSDYGFIDGVAHRSALSPIYNFYTQTSFDPVYSKETENEQCLLRPLFTTSFLLDSFFSENHYFDSQQIILTSASSKTALSLAWLINLRKQATKNTIQLIGLTSSKNKSFVEESGYYDTLFIYEDHHKINADINSSIVDFSGNHQLQFQIQTHLNNALKHNCLVGLVHWQAAKGSAQLPNKGSFFFAPTFAKKKQKEWGSTIFNNKLMEVWSQFVNSNKNWMNVTELQGIESLKEVYQKMLIGNFEASKGYIFSL